MSRGHKLVSNGTDTHLMLMSFIGQTRESGKAVTGKIVEKALDAANITANKNTVPFDPAKPFITSGIRLGTPAVTTRGMKEPEMDKIAGFIDCVVKNLGNEEIYAKVAEDVKSLCADFPLYTERQG